MKLYSIFKLEEKNQFAPKILSVPYIYVYTKINVNHGLVGCGFTIHRFHLSRKVRLPQQVSCIWHKTIWWRGSSNALGNVEYLFVVIAPRSTLARCGNTWWNPIYGWNRTKPRTYGILNTFKQDCFWHWNYVLMLNRFAWNKTAFKLNPG